MKAAVLTSWASISLALVCTGATIVACGSEPITTTSSGSSTSTSSSPTGGQGGSGDGGSSGSFISSGTSSGQTLTISPGTKTITITAKGTPATQLFTATTSDGTQVNPSWTLDDYNTGTIAKDGTFSTVGFVAGEVTVHADFGGLKATAKLTVKVNISEDVSQGAGDPGVSPTNHTALEGTPDPDPGASATPANPTKILYPYDQTVMPRGLTAPLLQFSPGNLPPEDAKIVLSSDLFGWSGYIHVSNGGVPQFSIPQDVWDSALQSSGGKKMEVDVIKASGGKAYGPATEHIIVADGSLKGALYYMTYQTPNNGLYVVKPGVKAPATLLKAGCVVCHSASANGTRLGLGADEDPYNAQSGIYNIGADGSATQLAGTPSVLVNPPAGGDSRDMSYATFTPDGKYVMRAAQNFWGGINQSAWRIDDSTKSLIPSDVEGLGANVAALVPTISPDGKRYAFINGPEESPAFGSPSRSISTMDLSIDDNSGTGGKLTFTNRELVLDNGTSGSVAKFPTFLPDSNYMVLQEGEGYQTAYDMMLPTWDANSTYTSSTGRLSMIKFPSKEHVVLANVNAGNATIDANRNYEPFSLPVASGGYYWIVFTSIREYGNVYQGSNVRKQIWVAAVSTTSPAGDDPSHPPFYLPNQSDTPNERGFWALNPCEADGISCESGDECCNGFCRPSDDNDPSSPKICKKPMTGECSNDSEKCTMSSDCCNASSTCVNGFCTAQSPQ